MRRFLSVLSLSFCFVAGLFAQAPVYLLFDWNCVDYLEYRTTSGNRVNGYNFHPGNDEQYLFISGTDFITASSLPGGTVSCRDFVLGETIVDAVNRRSRQVYMVQPASSGYTLTPLISATQIKRSGSIYKFYTTDCSFAVDTSNLRYNQNLTFAGDTYVYFNGYKLRDCRMQYAFEREPGRSNPIRSDLEFIPGIGMVADRSGSTHAEMEARSLRLIKVNDQLLDDYLASGCQNRPLLRNTLSRWSSSILPEPSRETYPSNTGVNELRPDMHSTPGGNPTPTYTTNPCPEPFQAGYHIVQRGETLNGIARAYGVDVKSLIALNNITQANKIELCQKLRLPASKGAPAAQPQGNVAQPQNSSYGAQDLTPYPYNYTASTSAPAPAQYNFSNNASPAVAEPGVSPSTNYIHVVQPGEYLYQIARSHKLTETQIRKFNGFPPIGTVLLYPGNQLWLVDPNQVYKNTPPTQPSQGNVTQPGSTDPQRPTEYSTDPRRYVFEETPADGNSYIRQYDAKAADTYQQPVQPLDAQRPYQYGYDQPVSANTRKPTHYQEYIVLSGDTMGAIASQNRITVAELAAANEKNPNESLIPGQRLLIPKFAARQ